MFNSDSTCGRILEAVIPVGAVVKQVSRGGRKVFAAVLKGVDVAVADSREALAVKMEASARETALTCTSPDTHLFGGPCKVEFGPSRGEFYLVNAQTRVHLSWQGPGTRWTAYDMETGARLVYGPRKDFKLAWTQADRDQPALRAWLAY